MLINSFNAATDWFAEPHRWGSTTGVPRIQRPGELVSPLLNSLRIWGLTTIISLPIGIAVAWTLARTRIPFSHSLEFLFWIAYMVPVSSNHHCVDWFVGPQLGLLNKALTALPFIEQKPV